MSRLPHNTFFQFLFLCIFSIASKPAFAQWWWPFHTEESGPQIVAVAEPFVEMRTGPANVYPVVHVSEQGEQLTLLLRKTNWMKVRDDKGREGWVSIEDIVLTKDIVDGESVAITAPRFDDYKTRRWEGGLLMGEYDKTAVNAAYIGYWMTENLSAELWGSQVLGNRAEIRFLSVNLTHQPFPSWKYSPFFSLGLGEAYIRPKETFIRPSNTTETQVNVGIGMRLYVTDRFFARMEVKDYKLFTQEKLNEDATEWKLGLSVFF